MKAERVATSLLSTVMSVTPAQEILQVKNLTKTIQNGPNRVEILRGLSFAVARGEFIAIMGASGSGKSTLLGLMAGLDNAASGEVILDGINITGMPEDELARVRGTKIGFVFQSYQLVSTLTAEENVLLPAELIGLRGNIEERARELLDRVGLQNRRHHYVHPDEPAPYVVLRRSSVRSAPHRARRCGPAERALEDDLGDVDWCWRLWLAGQRVLTSATTSVVERSPVGPRKRQRHPRPCAAARRSTQRTASSPRCSSRRHLARALALSTAVGAADAGATRRAAGHDPARSRRPNRARGARGARASRGLHEVGADATCEASGRRSSATACSATNSSSRRSARSSAARRARPRRRRLRRLLVPREQRTRPVVLILCSDDLGASMAGPAIRSVELARALMPDVEPVIAAHRVDPAAELPVSRLRPSPTEAPAALLAEVDAVVLQGPVTDWYPEILRSDVPVAVDLYDPMHLEALEHRRRRRVAVRAEPLIDQVARGDFFLCASERQRDYWLGMLSSLGRIDAGAYAEDPDLRSLIDVVPFGISRSRRVRAGPGPRDDVDGHRSGRLAVRLERRAMGLVRPRDVPRAIARRARRAAEDARATSWECTGRARAELAPPRSADGAVRRARADRRERLLQRLDAVRRAPGHVPRRDRRREPAPRASRVALLVPHAPARCIWGPCRSSARAATSSPASWRSYSSDSPCHPATSMPSRRPCETSSPTLRCSNGLAAPRSAAPAYEWQHAVKPLARWLSRPSDEQITWSSRVCGRWMPRRARREELGAEGERVKMLVPLPVRQHVLGPIKRGVLTAARAARSHR